MGRWNNIPGWGWSQFYGQMKQQAKTIHLMVPERCAKCGKSILGTGKRPVADLRTGHGYCDLLCMGLHTEQRNVITTPG